MLGVTLVKDCWVQLYSAIALELGGTMAVKEIELGVAYAIWSGVGIIATSVLGVILFNESITLRKFISVAIILVGVVSLNLTATE
ncbi:MAG: DMT family transporter [Desulfovibrio sp.]|uniref:DMT family transporter n=1 Tax=Desulfovibrio sp. 7SRBS1 TaxID=3378064 RepID=UPI003B418198